MNIENYNTSPSQMPPDQKHLCTKHEFMAGYEKISSTEYKLFIEALQIPSPIHPSCKYNFIYIQPFTSLKTLNEVYHEITENLLKETGYYDNQSSGVLA